jgi:hypothetical protein
MWVSGAQAAANGVPNANRLDVLGNLQGGGTVSAGFDLGGGWQTFVLPGTFVNLSSVVLSGSIVGGSSDASLSFDNIVVNGSSTSAVPEPSTLALLGVGMCGLLVRYRRVVRR